MSLARRAGLNIALKGVGEASRLAWALLLILVARRLGGEALGRISFAYSFTIIFVLLADLGVSILAVREVARQRAEAARYLGNLLAFKLVCTPVAFGAIAFAIVLSGYPTEVVTVVLLFAGINLARGLLDLYGAVLSGLEMMGREAALKHLHQVSLLVSGGLALVLGYGPTGLAVGLLIGSLVVVAIGSGMVGRAIRHVRLLWDIALWATLLRRAFPVALVTGFLLLCNESDIILLSYLGQAEREIGWYAAASKILKMLHMIPMLVVSGVYPVFSDLARGAQGSLDAAYRGTLKLLLVIAIPLAIAVAGLAEPMVRAIYGRSFTAAAVPLRVLACSIPFVYLGYAMVNVLVSSDHLGWAALATGAAGALTVAANLLLIPIFGIAGSALAVVVAQLSLVVIGAIATERTVTRSRWLSLASKPAMAGAAMLVAVALVGGTSWGLALVVGLGVYVVVLGLTGALREEEFVAVKRLWSGRA